MQLLHVHAGVLESWRGVRAMVLARNEEPNSHEIIKGPIKEQLLHVGQDRKVKDIFFSCRLLLNRRARIFTH